MTAGIAPELSRPPPWFPGGTKTAGFTTFTLPPLPELSPVTCAPGEEVGHRCLDFGCTRDDGDTQNPLFFPHISLKLSLSPSSPFTQ